MRGKSKKGRERESIRGKKSWVSTLEVIISPKFVQYHNIMIASGENECLQNASIVPN